MSHLLDPPDSEENHLLDSINHYVTTPCELTDIQATSDLDHFTLQSSSLSSVRTEFPGTNLTYSRDSMMVKTEEDIDINDVIEWINDVLAEAILTLTNEIRDLSSSNIPSVPINSLNEICLSLSNEDIGSRTNEEFHQQMEMSLTEVVSIAENEQMEKEVSKNHESKEGDISAKKIISEDISSDDQQDLCDSDKKSELSDSIAMGNTSEDDHTTPSGDLMQTEEKDIISKQLVQAEDVPQISSCFVVSDRQEPQHEISRGISPPTVQFQENDDKKLEEDEVSLTHSQESSKEYEESLADENKTSNKTSLETAESIDVGECIMISERHSFSEPILNCSLSDVLSTDDESSKQSTETIHLNEIEDDLVVDKKGNQLETRADEMNECQETKTDPLVFQRESESCGVDIAGCEGSILSSTNNIPPDIASSSSNNLDPLAAELENASKTEESENMENQLETGTLEIGESQETMSDPLIFQMKTESCGVDIAGSNGSILSTNHILPDIVSSSSKILDPLSAEMENASKMEESENMENLDEMETTNPTCVETSEEVLVESLPESKPDERVEIDSQCAPKREEGTDNDHEPCVEKVAEHEEETLQHGDQEESLSFSEMEKQMMRHSTPSMEITEVEESSHLESNNLSEEDQSIVQISSQEEKSTNSSQETLQQTNPMDDDVIHLTRSHSAEWSKTDVKGLSKHEDGIDLTRHCHHRCSTMPLSTVLAAQRVERVESSSDETRPIFHPSQFHSSCGNVEFQMSDGLPPTAMSTSLTESNSAQWRNQVFDTTHDTHDTDSVCQPSFPSTEGAFIGLQPSVSAENLSVTASHSKACATLQSDGLPPLPTFRQRCPPPPKKKTGGIDVKQIFSFLTRPISSMSVSSPSTSSVSPGRDRTNDGCPQLSICVEHCTGQLPSTSSCCHSSCGLHATHTSHTSHTDLKTPIAEYSPPSSATDGSMRRIPSKKDNILPGLKFFRQSRKADVDQIRRWKKSFDCLLSDPNGLELFHNYLKTEYSQENIQFWSACEEYKNISSSKKMNKEAQRIYQNFLSIQAPQEVNLDSKTRIQTIAAVSNPNKRTFENAQKKIHALMEKDSYPRFLRSEFYQNALRDAIAQEND